MSLGDPVYFTNRCYWKRPTLLSVLGLVRVFALDTDNYRISLIPIYLEEINTIIFAATVKINVETLAGKKFGHERFEITFTQVFQNIGVIRNRVALLNC